MSIHDKHIELIVRQMTRRVVVQEPGDSRFLPGEAVDAKAYTDENKRLVQEGKKPAEGRPVHDGHHQGVAGHRLVAVGGVVPGDHPGAHRGRHRARSDGLKGLKENIIIGKLIPAGTGMEEYRDIATEAPEYKPMEYWSSEQRGPGHGRVARRQLRGDQRRGRHGGNGDLAAVVGLPSAENE